MVFYRFELNILPFFDDLYHSYLASYCSVIDLVLASSAQTSDLVSNVNRGYFGKIHPQYLVIILGVKLQYLYESSLISEDNASMKDDEVIDLAIGNVTRDR